MWKPVKSWCVFAQSFMCLVPAKVGVYTVIYVETSQKLLYIAQSFMWKPDKIIFE